MNNRLRKILFPINIKLSIIVLLITGASLVSYLYLAIDMFKTDKIAYVFEAVESQNEQVALSIESRLAQMEANHELLPEATKLSSITEKVFSTNKNLIAYYQFKKNKLDKKIGKNIEFNEKEIFEKYKTEGFHFFDFKNVKYLVHKRLDGDIESILISDVDFLNTLIPDTKLYDFYLKVGGSYLGSRFDLDREEDLNKFFHQTTVLGEENKKIVSFRPTLTKTIVLIAAVSYDKAIEAASQLRQRSIYFGGLVVGLIILVVLFFSGLFTRPIKKLYFASKELAEANFSYRVKLSERDEIGALGDSFNFMAEKIQAYMEEMKEKVRLENELNTAKLVQESFFPSNDINGKNFKLNAYYRPASECGGDWWGYLKFEQTELVILLDVTGHGTAAALITAVIHNSLTALKYLAQKDPEFSKDPSLIMKYLNESLCSVNINLNATAFVLVVSDEGMSYCNASHNPPYFVRRKEGGEYSKQDFQPLMEQSGPRLGEGLEASYHSVPFSFEKRDHLILYTDGILEAKSSDDKVYGTRNFVKAFCQNLNLDNIECLNKTLDSFYAHLSGAEPDDDISLLKMEF